MLLISIYNIDINKTEFTYIICNIKMYGLCMIKVKYKYLYVIK